MRPIRLIELFSGVGAQSSALDRLGLKYENWITSEWDINAVASYRAIHCENDTEDYSQDIPIDEIINTLIKWQVSVNGKSPLTKDQIIHKSEKWQREVYSNFIATRNIGSVTTATAADLAICNTDKYTYMLTYSFPCQDLSVAGAQKGMSKNSGTRSGLLWEVERLLRECEELPHILVMENVPQVHGKKFRGDFDKWCDVLKELGYHNYWNDLNSKDYGVAQNRNRTFMVSFLKDRRFEWPEPIPLTKTMRDYLDDDVDDKYYIDNEKAQKLIDQLILDGRIPTQAQTPVDFTTNSPRERDC